MITIAYDVRRYRDLLKKTVKKGDTVIELGPHVGKGTIGYFEKTNLTVVIDKATQSEKIFRSLRREHDNLKFIKGDLRSFSPVKKVLKLTKECDVLAVDMGGGRFPDTVFKVWATWGGIFKPRDSVIRSRGLGEFVRRAKIKDESIPQNFPDAGWMQTFGRSTPYRLKKQLKEFKYWVNINESFD